MGLSLLLRFVLLPHLVTAQILNPYPAMQSLYLVTKLLQSSWGSSARENSMHSSRWDFSSLHTQHGLTFSTWPAGLRSAARLFGVDGWVTAAGCAGVGDELNQAMVSWTIGCSGSTIKEPRAGRINCIRAHKRSYNQSRTAKGRDPARKLRE